MFEKLQHKKGSASLYLLLLAAAVGIMLMLKECSAETLPPRNEAVASGDTLNVAIEISPVGVTMDADTLSGTYYNIVRQICSQHNRPVRFHPFTQLETALEGLDKGKYQLVVSDIPATAHMKSHYIFMNPIGLDRQVLVQRRDSSGHTPISSQFDLAKQKITLPKGSPFITRLHNLAREIGDTIYIHQDSSYSSEQLIILTAIGEADNVVVNAGTAAPLLKQYPNLDASLEISFNQFQGWALAPRDSMLRDTLNAWLSEIHHNLNTPTSAKRP